MARYVPPEWKKRIIELWGEPRATIAGIVRQMEAEGKSVTPTAVRDEGTRMGLEHATRRRSDGRPPSPDGTGKKHSPIREPIRQLLMKRMSVADVAAKGYADRSVRHYRAELIMEMIASGRTDGQIMKAINVSEGVVDKARAVHNETAKRKNTKH